MQKVRMVQIDSNTIGANVRVDMGHYLAVSFNTSSKLFTVCFSSLFTVEWEKQVKKLSTVNKYAGVYGIEFYM